MCDLKNSRQTRKKNRGKANAKEYREAMPPMFALLGEALWCYLFLDEVFLICVCGFDLVA